DGAGEAVPDAYVHWRSLRAEDSRRGFRRVRPDGTFSLRDLPEGEVDLEAEVGGSPSASNAKARVPSGSRGVTLVTDLGASLSVLIGNWPSGLVSGEAGVWPAAAGPPDGDGAATHWVDFDGTVVFRGLRPGVSYTLAVLPAGDLSLVQPRLRPGPAQVRV